MIAHTEDLHYNYSEIFRKAGSPAYLFDIDALKERLRMIRDCLGSQIRLVYAMKANPFLVRPLMDLVDSFEVCSPGEERICRRLGVPGEKLVLSGVNKEEENFADILSCYADRPLFTVESERQAQMLSALAAEKGLRLRALLRVSDGNQFGMDEQVLRRILRDPQLYPGLSFTGIQLYTGTQKKPRQIWKELARLDGLLCEHPALEEAEYGPGLAVPYFLSDHPMTDEELLGQLRGQLMQMRFGGQISLEMGRFISAWCGRYLTRIEDVKSNDGTNYCITDGGIHQVNYYGQNMAMRIPHIAILRGTPHGDVLLRGDGTEPAAGMNASDMNAVGLKAVDMNTAGMNAVDMNAADMKDADMNAADVQMQEELPRWTICGSLCTTADVLVREFPAKDLQVGDILIFERTGAYAVTEGVSLFLSRDLPRVWLLEGGRLTLVREKYLTEGLNCGDIAGDT